MIRSMIILTFIVYSGLSLLGFKFKTGIVVFYNLSLTTFRISPLVWVFTNVHGINQQHKLEPKIIFNRFFKVICCICKLEYFGALLEPYLWLPSHLNLRIVSINQCLKCPILFKNSKGALTLSFLVIYFLYILTNFSHKILQSARKLNTKFF